MDVGFAWFGVPPTPLICTTLSRECPFTLSHFWRLSFFFLPFFFRSSMHLRLAPPTVSRQQRLCLQCTQRYKVLSVKVQLLCHRPLDAPLCTHLRRHLFASLVRAVYRQATFTVGASLRGPSAFQAHSAKEACCITTLLEGLFCKFSSQNLKGDEKH